MRILITGGTGLIGRALAAELAGAGHDVVVLSRTQATELSLPAGVRAERWDARTAQGWGALVDGAGAIVHLAGASLAGEGRLPSRWTPERKQVLRESRLQAGAAVLEAVRKAQRPPRVLIQASGIGIYGDAGDALLTEAAPAGRDFAARLAVDWEASTAAVESLGVRRAIMRTGLVLSDAGGMLPRVLLPFRLFAGGPMGSGRQWWPWIHLADEVRAIRFLIENEQATGPFNLCAPAPLTNAAFARTVGLVTHRPAWLPVPAPALRLVMGELAEVLLLQGQRAQPARLTELGFTFRFSDAEAALRDLLA